jgi:hypothetical protein
MSDDTFIVVAPRCGSCFLWHPHSPTPPLVETSANTLFISEASDHREAPIWTASFFRIAHVKHQQSEKHSSREKQGGPGERVLGVSSDGVCITFIN